MLIRFRFGLTRIITLFSVTSVTSVANDLKHKLLYLFVKGSFISLSGSFSHSIQPSPF